MSSNHFISGAEILEEVARSKASYCSFADGYGIHFDDHIQCLSQLTPDRIFPLKAKRFKRDRLQLRNEAKANGMRSSSSEYRALGDGLLDSYKTSDFVFRLPTYEHAPDSFFATMRKGMEPEQMFNFPPFKQFILEEDGSVREVGRSHWEGPFEGGNFAPKKGRMTEQLGSHFIKLVDRYSRRPNLRNYTYLDDMKLYVIGVLAEKGLKFDETKTSNTFAYYTSVIKMAFNRVLGFESKHQNIRDALLNEAGMNGSFKSQAREAE